MFFGVNLSYETKFRNHSEVCLLNMSQNIDILIENFSNVAYDEDDCCTELFSRMFYNIYNKSRPIRKKPWLDASLKLDIG